MTKVFMNRTPSRYERHHSPGNGGALEQIESAGMNGYPKIATPVYLLDDDASVLKATGRLLLAAGLEVETFSDPHAFLQDAQLHQPRVAVIDIGMPIMDGLEVQTRLGGIAPATRVIALTSKDDPAVRARVMEGGASAFFLKPANAEEFLSCIRGQLNGN